MTDFLDEKRHEIAARLNELAPLVEEYNRLSAAAAALEEIGGPSATPAKKLDPPAGRKKVGRPKAKVGRPKAKKVGRPPDAILAREAPAVGAAPATGRHGAGRRKRSGARTAQVLTLVHEQPGITIPELATVMGIRHNYLYRVLPTLEQESVMEKRGRGWHLAAGLEPSAWVEQRTEWCPERKKWVPLGQC